MALLKQDGRQVEGARLEHRRKRRRVLALAGDVRGTGGHLRVVVKGHHVERRLEDQASGSARSPEGRISWREDVLYSARLEARMWRRLTAPIVVMMAVGLTWGSVLSVQQGQPWAIGWMLLVPPLAAAMMFGIFRLGRNRARDGLVTLTEAGFSYLPGPYGASADVHRRRHKSGAYVTGNGPITRPAKAGASSCSRTKPRGRR